MLYQAQYSSRQAATDILELTPFGTYRQGPMWMSLCSWSMSKSTKRASQRSQRRSKLLANAKKLARLMNSTPTQAAIRVWNELGGSCLRLARVKLRPVVRLEARSGQMNAPPAILIAVHPLSQRGLHLPRIRKLVRPAPLARRKYARAKPTDAQDLCLLRSFASRAPVLEAVPRLPGHQDFATNAVI